MLSEFIIDLTIKSNKDNHLVTIDKFDNLKPNEAISIIEFKYSNDKFSLKNMFSVLDKRLKVVDKEMLDEVNKLWYGDKNGKPKQ